MSEGSVRLLLVFIVKKKIILIYGYKQIMAGHRPNIGMYRKLNLNKLKTCDIKLKGTFKRLILTKCILF